MPATDSDAIAAFELVFDAEFAYVCRALRRLGVFERDIEDIAQDVFVAVYSKFGDWDRKRPVRPWLFGFAFRMASNYKRGAQHRVESGGIAEDQRPVDAPSPEESLSRKQRRDQLLDALQSIPLVRRSALIMHDIDGFSVNDVSELLSIPVNTVYSRLRVARRELESALRKQAVKHNRSVRGSP